MKKGVNEASTELEGKWRLRVDFCPAIPVGTNALVGVVSGI
jgi:hypothetical protein